MTSEPVDRFPRIAGAVMIAVVVVTIAYAAFLFLRPTAPAPVTSLADLERALAAAKKACVEGPPQGPSCAEAARLTTEIAERGRAR
jgi:hypothetical protein